MKKRVHSYTYKGESLALALERAIPEIRIIADQFGDENIESITVEVTTTVRTRNEPHPDQTVMDVNT